MNRTLSFFLLFSLAFTGCGDSDTSEDGSANTGSESANTNSASTLGSEPEPGPANEINAQITGSDGSETTLSGSAEDVMPETNQALVFGGRLTVFLSASDGTQTAFDVDAPSDAIPGTVNLSLIHI